jgi:glycosyltransferase involved in cell wall biosynthesis
LNVLYLIHHAGQGGTERYVLSVAQSLRDAGLVNPFFAYTEDGLLRERMEALGVPAFRVKMPGRYSLKAAKAIAVLCREHRIGVIHTHFLRENYIALLSRLFYSRTRVVYTNHLILPNNFITRLSNRLLSPLQRIVLAGCIPGEAQLVKNGIPKRKITIIHNGVEPGLWSKVDGAPLRKELGLPDEMFVMLYSARFAEGKGHAFLLEAVSMLKAVTERPFRLLLAGDGPLLGEVKALTERLALSGEVVFLGFREDMRSLLSAADLCVNASESETICMSILEGMAAGLPVVATAAGGTPELVTDGAGLLVPYGQASEMAEALRVMLEEPDRRKRCAENALAVIHNRYTAKKMVEKIYFNYQEEKTVGTEEKAL